MPSRETPQDQEVFAYILQLLRAAADDNPSNDVERDFVSQLREAPTQSAVASHSDVARNLVQNFDRLTPTLRRRALGPFENQAIAPSPRAAPSRPVGRRVLATIPRVRIHGDPGAGQIAGGQIAGEGANNPAINFYAIDYRGFHCEKVVGDAIGSDEVYAITSVVTVEPNGANTVRTEKHPVGQVEYGDVDLAETRLGPVARCYQGRHGMMSLTVVAFERDHGDPNFYRDEVHALVLAAAAAATRFGPIGVAIGAFMTLLSVQIRDVINWFLDTDDDQVDIARTAIFDLQTIEELGRGRKQFYIANIYGPFGDQVLGSYTTPLQCHYFSVHTGGGGQYVFGFDFVRDPEFVLEDIQVE